MDIRGYFQKEEKGFYKIITETLTPERRKQLYDAINDWHKSELKLLGIPDVVVSEAQCEHPRDKLIMCGDMQTMFKCGKCGKDLSEH